MHEFGRWHEDGTVDVRFSVPADPTHATYLVVDFLFDWPDIEPMRLSPRDGRLSIDVRLPADVELAYGFVRRNPEAPRTRDVEELFELMGGLEPDPDVAEHITDAFSSGTSSSILRGPHARDRHPVFDPGAPARQPLPARHLVQLHDRSLVVISPERPRRLALFLDGDVWDRSLDLPDALRRWAVDDTAVVLVPTPDRMILAERDHVADLAVDAVSRVEELLGLGTTAADVAIAGQSFGGLAAASVVADRRERIGTGIISSGSFWWRTDRDARAESTPGELLESLQHSPLDGTRFYVHVGREEDRNMVDLAGTFADVVRAQGARVESSTHPGGHDHAWYRHAVFDALDHWI